VWGVLVQSAGVGGARDDAGMTEPAHQWSPPSHPDQPEDQPRGVAPDDRAVPVAPFAPVTVEVEFSRSGVVRVPGFVERAGPDRVFVQLVHMGHPHRLWLPRTAVRHRTIRARRN
jgi:hypothetical protein